jgi:RepB DNA-primase from phage plasmid
MLDRGFFLTWQAVRRQLMAMPNDLYLVRLIHHATHRAFPGERLWTAAQLTCAATIRFLRLRNREGCDIYIHPYSGDHNAGYILLDLDTASPTVLETMRLQGLEPCVVLQTSPGHDTCAPHLQAWLHLSRWPLEPALATSVAQRLARTYGGDLASAGWCHLGRLAGFTNQKPDRRTHRGLAPWVTVLHARAGLAPRAQHLLQSAIASGAPRPRVAVPLDYNGFPEPEAPLACTSITARQAVQTYRYWTRRWNIADRFAQPDWSIVDLWVARALLSQGTPAARVRNILQLGSPEFPRRHGNPQDYLRRTLARAAFSCPPPPPPVWVAPTPVDTSAESLRAAASTHAQA